jgi:mono/diheme cytochrome c family protein
MRSGFSLFLIFAAVALFSCDGVFPTQTKETVPSDHTQKINGVFHASVLGDPLGEGGCKDCHGKDLKGGVADANGGKTVAPSCYECHGALWEGGGEREDD